MMNLQELKVLLRNLADEKYPRNQIALSMDSGLHQSQISRALNTKTDSFIEVIGFLKMCKALGIDVEEFIRNGGQTTREIVDGTDLKIATEEYLREATTDDLLKLKKDINRLIPLEKLDNTFELREKILDPETECSSALKEFAHMQAWDAYSPTPEEIGMIQRGGFREGPPRTGLDYIQRLEIVRSITDEPYIAE